VFNDLRYAVKTGCPWRDLPPCAADGSDPGQPHRTVDPLPSETLVLRL